VIKMADKLLASNEIKKFLAAFRSLQLVAEELEKVGSLEQLLSEKHKDMLKFQQEKEDAQKVISKMEAQIISLREDAAVAEEKMKEFKQQLSVEKELIKKEHEAEIQQLKQNQAEKIKSLDDSLVAKKKELDSMAALVQEKSKLYDETMAKIENLKRGL